MAHPERDPRGAKSVTMSPIDDIDADVEAGDRVTVDWAMTALQSRQDRSRDTHGTITGRVTNVINNHDMETTQFRIESGGEAYTVYVTDGQVEHTRRADGGYGGVLGRIVGIDTGGRKATRN